MPTKLYAVCIFTASKKYKLPYNTHAFTRYSTDLAICLLMCPLLVIVTIFP